MQPWGPLYIKFNVEMPKSHIGEHVVNLYLAWDLSRDEASLRYVAVGQ